MHTEDFRNWLSQASELTPSQRQQAIGYLRQEQQPIDVIGPVLNPDPTCPYCHHAPCGRWGNNHGLPRYRCSVCHKMFNALMGTPLAHLRHREYWPEYAQA